MKNFGGKRRLKRNNIQMDLIDQYIMRMSEYTEYCVIRGF
jgi:hypothetical protein